MIAILEIFSVPYFLLGSQQLAMSSASGGGVVGHARTIRQLVTIPYNIDILHAFGIVYTYIVIRTNLQD